MGEYDRYGFGYAYPDGLFSEKIKGKELLFYYYREDNDGHGFMRKGSEERIVVKLQPGVPKESVLDWLNFNHLDSDVDAKVRSEVTYIIK